MFDRILGLVLIIFGSAFVGHELDNATMGLATYLVSMGIIFGVRGDINES
jgi:membrane-bound ClpP family serine protease